jgi:general stress protein 26
VELTYNIAATQRRALIAGTGKGTFDEFVAIMDRLVADPAFWPEYDVMADFRQLRYSPSLREVRRFANIFGRVRSEFRGRVAFVVADKLQLRLGRFASMLARVLNFEIATFEDRDQAGRWLDSTQEQPMPELITNLRALLQKTQLASLATVSPDGAPWVRYVTIHGYPDLTVRFATAADSRKLEHISGNPRVHLTTGVEGAATAAEWVQMAGLAEVLTDPGQRRDFWSDPLKAYFDGPDDPNYVLVIIRPQRIEYMQMSSVTPQVWEPETSTP